MDGRDGSFVLETRMSQGPEQSSGCHSISGPLPDISASHQCQPESPITTVDRECTRTVPAGLCLEEELEENHLSSDDEMEENLVPTDSTSENRLEGDCGMNDSLREKEMEGKSVVAVEGDVDMVPVVGMEFESVIEAHNFYNHYANNVGFSTKKKRTNSSKINGLIHVLFTCVKEGFKQIDREAKRPRPPTREGCNARMRIKLMPSQKWRVTEVITNHSHIVSPLFITKHTCAVSPLKSSFHKSHTVVPLYKTCKILPKMIPYVDSRVHSSAIVGLLCPEVRENENLMSVEKDARNFIDLQKQMSLAGDAQSIFNYFTLMQTKNPGFFYAVDVDKGGHLRNVFWADARANAAYGYFGDVVMLDTTYLTNRYDMPFVLFLGVNHHWQLVLLGCGLVANETKEAFCWLFKTWALAMLGRHPSAIITDHCISIQTAVAEVFPNAHHCLCLWGIMKKFKEKLGSLSQYKEFKRALKDCVYDSLTVEEFEKGWVEVITCYDLLNNEWLQMLYKIREQWVPVYLKGTFFAGIPTSQRNKNMNAFFDGFVHSKTSFNEFFQNYNLAVRNHYGKESQADFESFLMTPPLKTNCQFESQAASLYTRDIFYRFQEEICGMCNCTVRCIRPDGPLVMYMVKEHQPSNVSQKKNPKHYEVSFNACGTKVYCICRLFEYHGILCRHALCVLRDSDVENIPPHYFLPRWKKDFKRKHVLVQDRAALQNGDAVQRYDDLYRRIVEIAEKGSISQGTYEAALQAIEETLKKISFVNEVVGNIDGVQADKPVNPPPG